MTLQNDIYGRTITSADNKTDTIYTITDPQNQGGNVAFTLGFPMGTDEIRVLNAIEAMAPSWHVVPIADKELTKAEILKKLTDLTTQVNNL